MHFCLLILPTFFIEALSSTLEVKAPSSIRTDNSDKTFSLALLNLALTKSTPEFPVRTIQVVNVENIVPGRTFNFLLQKQLDVFWSASTAEYHQQALAIKIPMYRGLLGYRAALIHKDNEAEFSSLKDPSELKQRLACQGLHWPDTDILRNNGFNVMGVAGFDSLFKMVHAKRCDYFPRSIFEIDGEFNAKRGDLPDLRIFSDILLHYPLYFLMYVRQDEQQLASQIEFGLSRAFEDGSYIKLFESHPVVQQIYPISKWCGMKIIDLDATKTLLNVNEIHKKYLIDLSSVPCEIKK